MSAAQSARANAAQTQPRLAHALTRLVDLKAGPGNAGPTRLARGWPDRLRLLLLVLAFNTFVAVVLWSIQSPTGQWWEIWVVSQCIGLCICGLAVLFTNVPLARSWRSPWARAALFVPAAVLGYPVGLRLGLALLGYAPAGGGLWHMSANVGSAAVVTTVLASAFCAYAYLNHERLSREAFARQRAEALATATELQLLRAQLQPHMLFNTLANLRALIGEDPKAAQGMLDSFNLFLRGVLAASRTDQHSLQAEFAQLQAYLELMAVRMGPRFSWQLQLPPELSDQMLPCMILQPLVENAIKHGLEPQVGPVHLSVSAKLSADGQLRLNVQDSGRGLTQAWQALPALEATPMQANLSTPGGSATGGSYGLAHVRERLRSAYPGHSAGLSLGPVPAPGQGCLAQIHLPSRTALAAAGASPNQSAVPPTQAARQAPPT